MLVGYQTYFQLRNSSIVEYQLPIYDYNTTFNRNQTTFTKTDRNQAYSGQMKSSTQKRIRKALDLFLQASPTERIYNTVSNRYIDFRLAFITLTISSKNIQEHKDCYKNLLRPFLQWLQKTKHCNSYIWKAELQKRGQIHYHITTNTFIHHSEVREKWNYLQRKFGLIANNQNPPSTEIKQVKKIENIEHYLAKYIAKSESEDKKINGKVWDCSENLKRNKYYTIEESNVTAAALLDNGIETELIKEIHLDNAIIYKMQQNYLPRLTKGLFEQSYKQFINSIKTNQQFTNPIFYKESNLKQKLENEKKELIARKFKLVHKSQSLQLF